MGQLKFSYTALLLPVAVYLAATAISGCGTNGGVYVPEGIEVPATAISFGARQASSERSRTYYDPSRDSSSGGYRILWQENTDEIFICSPQTVDVSGNPLRGAVYSAVGVDNADDGSRCFMSLTSFDASHTSYPVYSLIGGRNRPLCWNRPDDGTKRVHEFFAAYPASHVVAGPDFGSTDGNIIEMEYVTDQKATVVPLAEGSCGFTASPDMGLAYMMCRKALALPSGSNYRAGERVTLDFTPIMTTLHINLPLRVVDGTRETLTGISVILNKGCESDNLRYRFAETPEEGMRQEDISSSGNPGWITDTQNFTETFFTGFFNPDSGKRYVGFVADGSVDCMVFLPPFSAVHPEDVRIRVHMAGSHDFSVSLGGDGVEYTGQFPGELRAGSRIRVTLPAADCSIRKSDCWMSRLDQDLCFAALSLPGYEFGQLAASCPSPEVAIAVSRLLDAGVRVIDLRSFPFGSFSTEDASGRLYEGVFSPLSQFLEDRQTDSRKGNIRGNEFVVVITRDAFSSPESVCGEILRSGEERWKPLLVSDSKSFYGQPTLRRLLSSGHCLILDEITSKDSDSGNFALVSACGERQDKLPRDAVSTVTCFHPYVPEEIFSESPGGEIQFKTVDCGDKSAAEEVYDLIASYLSRSCFTTTGALILSDSRVGTHISEEDLFASELFIQGVIDCNYRFRKHIESK